MAPHGCVWVAAMTFMVTVLMTHSWLAVSGLPIQTSHQCVKETGANCSTHLRVERGTNRVCPTFRVPVPPSIEVC